MATNKKGTSTPSQQATNAAANAGTPGITNMSGVGTGTATPSQQAQDAVSGLNTGTTSVKTNLPGNVTINVDEKGNPIAYYPVGYAENLFAGYARVGGKTGQASISNIQKKLNDLKLYPAGYTPTYGTYTPTDVETLNKITYIGEQIKEPDINNLFKKIQTDPKLLKLAQTGGASTTRTKTLTSASEAGATLTDQFLNVFNVKPTAAEVKAYTAAINAKEKASKTGLSSQERQDILLNVMNQKAASISKGALSGDTQAINEGSFGRTVRSLRDAYFSNGVKVTDATLYKQAAQAMRGTEAYNNIISNIQINAKAMLPALGQYIDQGKNARDILNSHIQTYADIYGLNPDQVDLNSISFVANGKNLLSTNDMVKQLWNTDPKIKETKYYKDIVTNDARNLLNMIGVG